MYFSKLVKAATKFNISAVEIEISTLRNRSQANKSCQFAIIQNAINHIRTTRKAYVELQNLHQSWQSYIIIMIHVKNIYIAYHMEIVRQIKAIHLNTIWKDIP